MHIKSENGTFGYHKSCRFPFAAVSVSHFRLTDRIPVIAIKLKAFTGGQQIFLIRIDDIKVDFSVPLGKLR